MASLAQLPRADSQASLPGSETSDPPEPKWWLLEWMNYLIMAIFLGSVGVHVSQTTFAPKLQRDATSLLPMLTIWSCCMAYFFGFFGISFVDKDEDLLMDFEGAPWDAEPVQELPRRAWTPELPRTLNSIVEDNDAATHMPSETTPRALSMRNDEPIPPEIRCAEDLQRIDAILEACGRSRTIAVEIVGPVSVDGRETLAPLACHSDLAQLVARGARVLRLAGGCTSAAARVQEAEIGICVACPTVAAAQGVADAALARAQLARKAPGTDAVLIVDARRVGRCCYARVASADAARAVDAIRRLNLPKGARIAAVSPASQQTARVACEVTVPGPILKRVLGASVADLCAASARRVAGMNVAGGVWRSDGYARGTLDAIARATGAPLFDGAVTCVVESANRGRDAHCSLFLEGVGAGGDGLAALLDLRGAALDGARVRAAACLAAELAGLAADAGRLAARPGEA